MTKKFLAVLLFALSFSTSMLLAHPGHDHSGDDRVWKLIDGKPDVEAAFVLARDEHVLLNMSEGEMRWVAIVDLAAEDREWLRERIEEVAARNLVRQSPTCESAYLTDEKPQFSLICAAIMVAGVLCLFCSIGQILRKRADWSPLATCSLAMLGSLMAINAMAQVDKKTAVQQKHFEPFKAKLELRSDDDFLYVGSDAFPDHPMMKGITSWQRQVPLPQPYKGTNAWKIPLKPKLAAKPISAKNDLFRGAIALAVNGVPIFNALNNRGEDAYLAGELDEFGGHCGRGDDYHYHIAPVHLEKTVGKGNPIAYALDGYPLYGFTDINGKEPKDLDEFNGRMEKDGYRYYSTRKYPYINGGLRAEVSVRGGQVDPQPKDAPVRPAGEPLRGAKITDFSRDDANRTYTLKYEVRGKTLAWKYTINKDGTYTFVYTNSAGDEETETYRRRQGKGGPPPKKKG